MGAVNVASLYDQAGDREKAIQWLETAYQAHDPNLGYVSVVPLTAGPVRDSRFQDLLRCLGLEGRHSGPDDALKPGTSESAAGRVGLKRGGSIPSPATNRPA